MPYTRSTCLVSSHNMQLNLVNIAVGLAVASLSSALPYEDDHFYSLLDKRAFSTDATCGNIGAGASKGLTCDPNLASGGGCCSASGYCGSLPLSLQRSGMTNKEQETQLTIVGLDVNLLLVSVPGLIHYRRTPICAVWPMEVPHALVGCAVLLLGTFFKGIWYLVH